MACNLGLPFGECSVSPSNFFQILNIASRRQLSRRDRIFVSRMLKFHKAAEGNGRDVSIEVYENVHANQTPDKQTYVGDYVVTVREISLCVIRIKGSHRSTNEVCDKVYNWGIEDVTTCQSGAQMLVQRELECVRRSPVGTM